MNVKKILLLALYPCYATSNVLPLDIEKHHLSLYAQEELILLAFNDLPLCKDRSYARVCITVDDTTEKDNKRIDQATPNSARDRTAKKINQSPSPTKESKAERTKTQQTQEMGVGQQAIDGPDNILEEKSAPPHVTEHIEDDNINLEGMDLYQDSTTDHDTEHSYMNELSENMSYELETNIILFKEDLDPSTKTVDDDHSELWARLNISSNLFIDDSFAINLEGNISYSTYHHMFRGSFREPHTKETYPAYIDLDVITVMHEGDDFDLLAGKDKVSIGLSEIYSPTNRFGIANGVNPQHTNDMGLIQARYRYYIDDDIFSIFFIPYEEHPPTPDPTSRWLGTTGDADFISISGLPTGYSIKDGYHSTNLANAGYLSIYEGIREGYDFFTILHHGPSSYPVLVRDGLVFTKEYPISTSIGGGISAVYDEWKLYSEAIYQKTEHDADQDFLKYVVGASYKETEFANSIGIDEIQPIIEYAGEEIIEEQNNSKYYSNSENARPLRDSVITQVQITFNDEWLASIHGTKNLDNKDYSFGSGLEYSYNDNLKFYMVGTFYHGKDETAYGRWRQNDNLELGFNYKF